MTDPFRPADEPDANVDLEPVEKRTRMAQAGARRAAAPAAATDDEPAADGPIVPLPALVGLVLAPLAALLPARWRARLGLDDLPLRLGAFVAAVVAGWLAFWAFGVRVVAWGSQINRDVGPTLGRHVGESHDQLRYFAVFGSGVAAWIAVLLSPFGFYCMYTALEAIVRATAVAVSGEIVPHGPLALADRVGLALLAWRDERRLGPLVVDEVTRSAGGGGLEIASCRPRPWPRGKVLLVDGAGWLVDGAVTLPAGARRFVYRLRPAPEGHIVRGAAIYRPDELVAARAAARRAWIESIRQAFRMPRRK